MSSFAPLHTQGEEEGGRGGHITLFFLHESSSRVEIRLHAENQIHGNPGSGLKVSVWVG